MHISKYFLYLFIGTTLAELVQMRLNVWGLLQQVYLQAGCSFCHPQTLKDQKNTLIVSK